MNALRTFVAATFLLATPAVLAAPCSGFEDLDSSSGFCPYVDWLKNRGVTMGCTSPTEYCPTQPVIRLSMAAFMNRLGAALTPVTTVISQSGPSTLDLDNPPPAVCAFAFPYIEPVAFPRSARLGAIVSARATTAATFDLVLVTSTDNGTTWTPLHNIPASAGGANRWMNVTAWTGNVDIPPGGAPRNFAVRITRAAGGGSGDLFDVKCQIMSAVGSRTGAAAPF